MLNLDLYEKNKKEVKSDLTAHNSQSNGINTIQFIFTSHKLVSIDDFLKTAIFIFLDAYHSNHSPEKIEGKEPQLLEEPQKLQLGNGNIDWLITTLT
jgi:hypothetical protein